MNVRKDLDGRVANSQRMLFLSKIDSVRIINTFVSLACPTDSSSIVRRRHREIFY